jgi:hypothetical protein
LATVGQIRKTTERADLLIVFDMGSPVDSGMIDSQGRFRIVLACDGVPTDVGPLAAVNITEEFTRRPWHQDVACMWDGQSLILQAENNFDPEGLALMDEFSDAISACIHEGFDGDIRIVAVTELTG